MALVTSPSQRRAARNEARAASGARGFITARRKQQDERNRHASGLGPKRPTAGRDPAYDGKGRGMTLEEKFSYARNKAADAYKELHSGTRQEVSDKLRAKKQAQKREDNLSESETQGRLRANFRDRLGGGEIRKRKQGVGVYTARRVTAEDLDKRGRSPKTSPAAAKLVGHFRKV